MTYTTKEGKEIVIFNEGRHRKIKFATGGELPEELKGLWTSVPDAERAIESYLARKAKKRLYSKVKKKSDASLASR